MKECLENPQDQENIKIEIRKQYESLNKYI